MKLLYCPECDDVFKLDYEMRSCKCGRCRGRYDKNGSTAVTNGKGMNIGLSNPSLFSAYYLLKNKMDKTAKIECWARPASGDFNPHMRVEENL